jgi:hypothetical protein
MTYYSEDKIIYISVVFELSKDLDELNVVELKSFMRESFAKKLELFINQGYFMEVHDAPESRK